MFKTANPALKGYEGKTIGEIAKERKCDPLDCLFDFAVEDKLATKFVLPRANTNPSAFRICCATRSARSRLSDGGAHVDMFCEAGYTTYMLGHWVREKKALTMEHAIKRMMRSPRISSASRTAAAQDGTCCGHRGLRPARVNSPTRGTLVHDLPAGGARLYAKAEA